jgi:hypothetical protein
LSGHTEKGKICTPARIEPRFLGSDPSFATLLTRVPWLLRLYLLIMCINKHNVMNTSMRTIKNGGVTATKTNVSIDRFTICFGPDRPLSDDS